MEVVRTLSQETSEDVFFGQVVIIWARWFLIAAGVVLIMWSLTEQTELIAGIIPIILLMFMNFYLHGRYLMEKPVGTPLIVATSLLDLLIITLLVLFWPVQEGDTTLNNQFFLFYYPMVLGFGFVMSRKIEVAYTVLAVVLYAAAVAADLGTHPDPTLTTAVAFQANLKTLLFRLIVLGAMGGLGNYYWRIQRARRRATVASG